MYFCPAAYRSQLAAIRISCTEIDRSSSICLRPQQAHTSPIWIVRDGLRPWKYDDVERLIDQRLESLRSIEELYNKRKANSNDSFVAQWPELEKRIAAARKIYEDLRDVAALEKQLRR